MHPANETPKSILFNVKIPAIISIIVTSLSLIIDFYKPGNAWFQRSGSIMTVVGAYIAFHVAQEGYKFIDNNKLFINNEIKYKWLGLGLAISGTLIWGYGDLPF